MPKPLTQQLNSWVEQKRVSSQDISAGCSSIAYNGRVFSLLLVPGYLLTSCIDTLLGSMAGVLAFVTLGRFSSLNHRAFEYLESSKEILSRPYEALLQTLFPQAKFDSNEINQNGLLYRSIDDWLLIPWVNAITENASSSQGIWQKQIFPRLCFTGLLLLNCLARAVDLLLGGALVVASLVTLGRCQVLNTCAFRALRVSAVVAESFQILSKVISPDANWGDGQDSDEGEVAQTPPLTGGDRSTSFLERFFYIPSM